MTNTVTTLVTGGSGNLGRAVVRRLAAAGHEVRITSRGQRPPDDPLPCAWLTVDYRTGKGFAEAVAGVDAIVHCASAFRDVTLDRTVIAAAKQAGGPHLVYISIVGIDRVPLRYYRTKLEAERLIEQSGLPWTILRATQFHDLVRLLLDKAGRLPVMPVFNVPVQPVDVGEVAGRLVDLATGEPAGRVTDLGGPEIRRTTDLAREYLLATGKRRLILPVRLPGRTFRAYRAGGHTTPEHADGVIRFADYLRERR